jgi:hypothetical protein
MPARSPPSPLYIRNGAVERTLTTRLLSAISPREIRARHPALGAHHKQQLERVEILPRHICNHLSAYVSIRQHTYLSAYVSIRQHTSAAVGTRWNSALEFCLDTFATTCQHTSAFVSIRQHTSAYVSSIRKQQLERVGILR